MSRLYRSLDVLKSLPSHAMWPTLLVLLLLPQIGYAQSPEATILHKFAWDYPDEWIDDFSIVRFEIRIDGGVAVIVGMSKLSDLPGSYAAPVPAMTVGQHLLEVRACSLTRCGLWSAPLLFGFSPPSGDGILQIFDWPLPGFL